mmetsp:Transcript_22151/g.40747  ORF Transcript_22151/g.40747 Transcript_22151/m.40747 type:complete len:92 (-) Transcript_22151:601-876(-)
MPARMRRMRAMPQLQGHQVQSAGDGDPKPRNNLEIQLGQAASQVEDDVTIGVVGCATVRGCSVGGGRSWIGADAVRAGDGASTRGGAEALQ